MLLDLMESQARLYLVPVLGEQRLHMGRLLETIVDMNSHDCVLFFHSQLPFNHTDYGTGAGICLVCFVTGIRFSGG
jgi:hypothetical protein